MKLFSTNIWVYQNLVVSLQPKTQLTTTMKKALYILTLIASLIMASECCMAQNRLFPNREEDPEILQDEATVFYSLIARICDVVKRQDNKKCRPCSSKYLA